tara:strand:- start:374 stop:613 length:240 start_codon:yes stop_codon:yes gene_type:complete
VNEASTHELFDEIVTTISSPATKAFAEAWACVVSVELTLLAVPPRAVVLILNVIVHVPDALRVVVFSMVPAKGQARTSR